MKANAVMAIALAAIMLVGAGVAVVAPSDSDAATPSSTMNIYIYYVDDSDNENWYSYSVSGVYNALQALQATGVAYTAESDSYDYSSDDYVIQKSNSWGDYDEINTNYGNVESIMGMSESGSTNIWNTYYYTTTGWEVGPQELGFITPFTDGAAPSANVVLYYGPETTSVPNEVITYMQGMTLASMIDPQGNNDYRYEIYLKVDSDYSPDISSVIVTYVDGTTTGTKTLEDSDLYNGITVVGYGSTAYAALKNAIGDNVNGTNAYGPYNGWLNSLFGLETESDGYSYVYWAQYDSTGSYFSFNLGSYSTLSNVPTDTGYSFVITGFQLIYG